MGEPLVSAIAQTLVENLTSSCIGLIGRLWDLGDELDKLKSTFSVLQDVLQYAEIKQSRNKPIQNWLTKLKDVAYEVEDILADMEIESRGGSWDSTGGNSFLSSITSVPYKIQIASKVKYLVGKISAIAEERHNYHLGDGGAVEYRRFGVTSMVRETDSWVIESEIYGRENEKDMVMNMLFDNARDQDDLFVYAICGMGGLGKTALAQLIYNDERTKQHFDLRMWVCVSDDFGIKRLVKGMLESIDGVECNISGLDLLVRRLRERLSGKKFLIILDDVWNEDYRLWNEMRRILRCNSRGSTLVVTTRIQQIASMMAKSNVHHIGGLRKEDSWSLFKQIAFSTGEADERLLSDIGKAMVEKCKGVPLAIKALGGLMQSKSEIDEWLVIKESKLWDVLDDENGVSHVLKLSYYNLPPHMRQCFAYSCVFPKDYEMEVDQLIQLWMANGFIPWDGQGDLLTSARSIFKDLVSRSFFQYIKNDHKDIKLCKMHDLMHDLATSVMSGEICILEHGNKLEVPRRIRHVFFNQSFDQIKQLACHSLRSFLIWNQGYETSPRASVEADAFSSFLLHQKYLRAVDMSFYPAVKLGFSSSKLKHLKYIVLQCHGLTRLPESLTHLSNLQTLRLIYTSQLQELHKDLKVMKNLSFLEIQSSDSLLCTPPGLGELRCLRKFPIFIVGQDAAQQIKEMKELNLEGRLIIKGLENVRSFEDAKSSNLVAKRNLTSLRLCWTKDDGEMLPQQFEEVLQGLEPHHNLEKLVIEHYCGSKLPNWMGSSTFYKLEDILLVQCRRCEHIPPLGNLPSLRRLTLNNMDSIRTLGEECLGDGECSFPALKVLEILSMSNLEEWIIPYSTRCFPCLICLCILGCPKLSKLPFLPSLRKLQMWESNAAVLTSIKYLTSLESFSLDCLDEGDFLPDDLLQNSKAALEELVIQATCIRTVSKVLDNLSSLKELTFNGCLKLEDLPNECLSSLHSLEKLRFSACDSLTTFPAIMLEGLPSLTSLSFEHCTKLQPLSGPFNGTSPLHCLEIHGIPELQCLPESLQQLSALRELCIGFCDGLSSFPEWIGYLESLSVLRIWNCNNLTSFPDSFTTLLSLRSLVVISCPELEKRYQKPDGEHWQKISHIPDVTIT